MNIVRNIFGVVLLLLSWETLYAQEAIRLSGKCVDEKGIPLPSVTISVFDSLRNNPVVNRTISDKEGAFSCDGILPTQTLCFSMVGYETVCIKVNVIKEPSSVLVRLKETPIELKEVIITPEILKSYGIKDEIILSQKDKEKGVNSLDVIGNLPQFRLNLSNGQLQTPIGKSILIVIDGKRASERELIMLQPKNIQKLVFYANPPSQYAHQGAESVLEVRTKRPKEPKYFLYIDTKNSFTTGYGTNLLSFTYTDSLSQISGAYFIDYRDLNSNLTDGSYRYDQHQNNYIGQSGSYRGQYHIGQVSYQRTFGNNLFFSKISYISNPGKERANQLFQSNIGYGILSGTNKKELDSQYHGWNFEVYYMKNFSNEKSLSFNLVNTYYSSRSEGRLLRLVKSDTSMDYSFNNWSENHSNSVIGEILYSQPLLGGQLNIGSYSMYKKLKQSFDGGLKDNPYYWKHYLYADFSKNIHRFAYTVGIGVNNQIFDTPNNYKYSLWLMRPLLALSYKFKDNSSIRWTSTIDPQTPEIGYLTNSKMRIDELFYIQGNPKLKPSYTYNNRLNVQYLIGKVLYVSPSLYYNYHVRAISPILLNENKQVKKTYVNINNMREYGGDITLSWTLFQHLTMKPYYQYQYLSYQTPNNVIKHHTHNAGVNVQFEWGKFRTIWNANIPFESVNGDLYTRNGLNMSANALWQYNQFSFGVEWIHNPNPSKVYGKIDHFHFDEKVKWQNFRSLFCLKATYYFSIGKQHTIKEPILKNNDTDTGLTRENTAK